MIADSETNIVYFSSLLRDRKNYAPFFRRLVRLLDTLKIRWGLLEGANDVWARDYMPIQVAKDKFVQFDYHPIYLNSTRDRKTITDGSVVALKHGIKTEKTDIKLDGGNAVFGYGKVIITERVFSENPGYSRSTLLKELKRLLKVKEVIIIPEEPDDEFGHADGMVKFLTPDIVIINKYLPAMKKYEANLVKLFSSYGIMAMPAMTVNYNMDGAGIPMNYMQIGPKVIYPIFGLKTDDETKKLFFKLFGPHAYPIRANEIAKGGGVLHCVSWNTQKYIKGEKLWMQVRKKRCLGKCI